MEIIFYFRERADDAGAVFAFRFTNNKGLGREAYTKQNSFQVSLSTLMTGRVSTVTFELIFYEGWVESPQGQHDESRTLYFHELPHLL